MNNLIEIPMSASELLQPQNAAILLIPCVDMTTLSQRLSILYTAN